MIEFVATTCTFLGSLLFAVVVVEDVVFVEHPAKPTNDNKPTVNNFPIFMLFSYLPFVLVIQ